MNILCIVLLADQRQGRGDQSQSNPTPHTTTPCASLIIKLNLIVLQLTPCAYCDKLFESNE